MLWHRYDDDDAELTSPQTPPALLPHDEPAPSVASPIVIALGIVLAVGGGALLSTLGSSGVDGLLNSAGLSRVTLADAQQQQGDVIASLDAKLSTVVAEIAVLKQRSNALARMNAGATDGGKLEADIAALRRGFNQLSVETGYLDLRVEAVANKIEAGGGDRIAELTADVSALKNEVAAMRTLHSEPTRGPLVGRLDTFEAGLATAETDLTGLRASFDGFAKTNRGDIAAITKRLDKIETAMAADVTGSLPRPAARKHFNRPGRSGWSVQEAGDGHAVITSRSGRYDVEQGSVVPGLGRVDAVRQQGNRWIVTTSRGAIVSRVAPATQD